MSAMAENVSKNGLLKRQLSSRMFEATYCRTSQIQAVVDKRLLALAFRKTLARSLFAA